jgi:hypothetical protein
MPCSSSASSYSDVQSSTLQSVNDLRRSKRRRQQVQIGGDTQLDDSPDDDEASLRGSGSRVKRRKADRDASSTNSFQATYSESSIATEVDNESDSEKIGKYERLQQVAKSTPSTRNSSRASTPSSCVSTSSALSKEKMYKCTYPGCEKSFTKPSRLGEHERVHTNEVRWACFCLPSPSIRSPANMSQCSVT